MPKDLQRLENAGFDNLCSEDSRFTWRDGVVLIGGAVVAWGFSIMEKSKPKAEEDKPKDPVEEFVQELREEGVVQGGLDVVAKRAMRAGLTAKEVSTLGNLIAFLPAENEESPETIEALKKIASWTEDDKLESKKRIRDILDEVSPDLDQDKLIFLANLPVEAFDGQVLSFNKGKIDWDKTRERAAEFATVPRQLLSKTGLSPFYWIPTWRRAKEDPKLEQQLYQLCAIANEKSAPGDDVLQYIAHELVSYNPETQLEASKALDDLALALKTGVLPKYASLVAKEDFVTSYEYLETLRHVVKLAPVLGDWGSLSFGALKEQIAITKGKSYDLLQQEDPRKGIKRSRDRLAQENPDWAITEYPDEYDRGVRIAPVMGQIANYLRDLTKRGEQIVIHGRDGELIYKVLERTRGADLDRVHYVLTSRPLTVWHEGALPRRYEAYLERMVPPNAVHIDTGFAGTIPRWFQGRGIPVKAIKMVSAGDKNEQIPLEGLVGDQNIRDMVLNDLEHAAQRLESPTRGAGFGSLTYSQSAPGFWARFYGVMDALKTPRMAAETPTRFASQARYKTEAMEPRPRAPRAEPPSMLVPIKLSKKKQKPKPKKSPSFAELLAAKQMKKGT